jgi:RND family efflux transporter MFP subunit
MRHKISINCFRPASRAMSVRYKYRCLMSCKVGARAVYFVLLSLLLTSAFPWSAVADPTGPGEGPLPVVTVATITLQDVNPPAEYVGHVEAIQYVDLRARVEGFLEQVNFKEGDHVNAGDLLYVIEQAPYKARVEAAMAKVAEAEARFKNATRHIERLRSARPESVRATDMDNAVAEELQAKAGLKAAKADLRIAEIDLDYTIIKAPINGRIGKTAYTRGNLVNLSSGSLARIVQMDPIRAVYSVSENDLPAIHAALHDAALGNKSRLLAPRLRLANGQVYEETCRMDFVDNEVDPSTGTIEVRAISNNPDGLLIPGQYVTALVKKSEPRMMPVAPQASVLVNQQGHYVLVVDSENRAESRPVTLGPAIGTFWAVESGLKAGEKVIKQGIQKVRPGQKVQIGSGGLQGR